MSTSAFRAERKALNDKVAEAERVARKFCHGSLSCKEVMRVRKIVIEDTFTEVPIEVAKTVLLHCTICDRYMVQFQLLLGRYLYCPVCAEYYAAMMAGKVE